ncbi:MAG: hypothetical protein GWN01_02530 [Nitrosopumilaceae archaeon]|nr:hypothetical protein [Nitrosopumilaceae archaeon]NIT99843.1 hypothetical protein [Nitrosopumilaceae archaeon]NIU86206.1 hypothetical protein [Nitrosopumilaceae archaeon]NIV64968.1 hypothetical protein [Nitrosopumilaceae archaeon]NIX60446.1 hypothetical protein [Nitrosopumilaceae archaeon]
MKKTAKKSNGYLIFKRINKHYVLEEGAYWRWVLEMDDGSRAMSCTYYSTEASARDGLEDALEILRTAYGALRAKVTLED